MNNDVNETGLADNSIVASLNNSAHFTIATSQGYVQIEQSHGGQVYYTPEEAREIASDILEAAQEAPDTLKLGV